MATSRVKNTNSHSREFRLDPLSLCRLAWLQSFFEHHGWKPSGSVIVRRALALYLAHVESLMAEEAESLDYELVRIKAHTHNEISPLSDVERFNGRPLSEMLQDSRESKLRDEFGLDRPSPQQSEQWRQLWEKLDRGEKV